MDNVVNVPLLSHPANWGIVWTVLLFGLVGWGLIHKGLAGASASST